MTQQIEFEFMLVDYFYILLMLFTSGSIFYFVYISPAIAYIIFFVMSYVLFVAHRGRLDFRGISLYVPVFCLMVLLNRYFFNPNVENNRWQALIVGCVGSYLYFSSFNFGVYRKALLTVMSYLTIPSIVVFILDVMEVLPVQMVQVDDVVYTMFGPFCVGRGAHFDRMASLWHEPGACQIFLNTVLLLYIPLVKRGELTKQEIRKLIIIVIGVLCTQSTTGYLILMIILFYMFNSRLRSMSFVPKLWLSTLSIIFFLVLLGSSVVVEKFSSDSSKAESMQIRQADNIACFMMSIQKPLTGYGIATTEFYDMSIQLDNDTSSNGLLQISAFLGICWLFVYLLFAFFAIRKMRLDIPVLVGVLIFVLLESNEAYVEYPISYLFVMRFREYFDSDEQLESDVLMM